MTMNGFCEEAVLNKVWTSGARDCQGWRMGTGAKALGCMPWCHGAYRIPECDCASCVVILAQGMVETLERDVIRKALKHKVRTCTDTF